MIKKAIACFLIISFALPIFSSCTKEEDKQVNEIFDCFDTYSTLTVYGSKEETEPFFKEFDEILNKYHKLFDIYNSYEDTVNLKTLNDTAKNGEIKVSKELFEALEFGIEMHEKTNGKLNVAIGAVTSIWHEVREKATKTPDDITLPTQSAIEEALTHTNINSVLLNKTDLSVSFTDSKLSLDFGGIAKGYVASLVYERLISLGCTDFLINLGGNVVSAGKKPDGTPWVSAIENPFEEDGVGYNKTVSLEDETLVTSGSYQRFFIYNGKNYSHIIDSSNGFPPELFSSVTVKTSQPLCFV